MVRNEDQQALIISPEKGNKEFHLQIIDLNNEKLVFDKRFMLVNHADCRFNREFYYSDSDFENAEYSIHIDGENEVIPFTKEEEEVFLPFEGGTLRAKIPKICIEENGGTWFEHEVLAEYIDNIPQTSVLKVTKPQGMAVRFYIDENEINCDENGFVAIGNALQSYRDSKTDADVKIMMNISGKTQNDHHLIARIFYNEAFLNPPEFWAEGKRLFWNRGGGFIGKNGRQMATVSCTAPASTPPPVKTDGRPSTSPHAWRQ